MRFPILGLLALIALLSLGATDWQTLSSQAGENRRFFYTSNGALVGSGGEEFRAYIIGADTSDADNQFDGVYDATSGGFDFSIPRDSWVSIYRIDGTDVVYEEKAFLHGGKGGKGAADDTTLVAGSVTSVILADSAVTESKITAGSVTSAKLGAGSVTALALGSASVTPTKLASGERFFSESGGDTLEAEVVEAALLDNPPGGAGTIRGSWTYDETGTVISFEGPQLEFADSVSFEGPVKLGTNETDLVTMPGDMWAKGDILFGSARSDSFSFKGPVHFDDVRLLDPSSAVCDSIPLSDVEKWVEVEGVSDLQNDGYYIHCRATPNFTWSYMYNNVGGMGWKLGMFAAPVRQGNSPVASDSVYVLIPSSPGLVTFPFCVECFGVK